MFTNTKRFFGLIVVLALAIGSAFAQVRPADLQRAETLRSTQRGMKGGHVVEATDVATPLPQVAQTKLFIFTDKKYYLPGEQANIRAVGFAEDATQLQIFVQEWYTDTQGNTSQSAYYPCDCGDGNSGYVPSLANFNYITLVSKHVPQLLGGRYDFTIFVTKLPGSNQPAIPYQTTQLTIMLGIASAQESNPIRIDQVIQGASTGPVLILVGKFPVNTPMTYSVGVMPYTASFDTEPRAVSSDGYTLVLPGFYAGTSMEGRVVLMLPDASFSTTSPQTFVPMPSADNTTAIKG